MSDYFQGPWSNAKPKQRELEEFCSLAPPICLWDVGSAGGCPPPFCWVIPGIRLVNFDPDERLPSDEAGANHAVAIGPPHLRTMHLNRRPTTSSLLPSNHKVVDRYDFSNLPPPGVNIFETMETRTVHTVGLDQAAQEFGHPPADFLKVDAQGLTLEVMETAGEMLEHQLLGLQVEVEFLPAYVGQKTVGVVQTCLEQFGFEIFRLTNLQPWFYSTRLNLKRRTGQHAFCDLLFLRGLDTIHQQPDFWTPERAAKLIQIALLHDLTDAAAAYYERFADRSLFPPQQDARLRNIIESWEDALTRFFWLKPRDRLIRMLGVSPLSLARRILRR